MCIMTFEIHLCAELYPMNRIKAFLSNYVIGKSGIRIDIFTKSTYVENWCSVIKDPTNNNISSCHISVGGHSKPNIAQGFNMNLSKTKSNLFNLVMH